MRAIVEGNYLAMTDEARARDVMAAALSRGDRKNLDIACENFKTYTPLAAEGFFAAMAEKYDVS